MDAVGLVRLAMLLETVGRPQTTMHHTLYFVGGLNAPAANPFTQSMTNVMKHLLQLTLLLGVMEGSQDTPSCIQGIKVYMIKPMSIGQSESGQ